jgi:hypothetical protein
MAGKYVDIPEGFEIVSEPSQNQASQAAPRYSDVPESFEVMQQPQQPQMSRGEAAFATMTNPLGFGDEIKAGLAAMAAKMFGGAVTKDIDIGDLYKEARDNERTKQTQAREQYPNMSGAIEMPSNIVRGAAKGLEETGLGIYQGAADFGADFSGAKAILSKIRPDLKNEIESLTPQDISSILGEKAAQDSKATEQEGLAYKTGRFAGKVAPFLGVGGTSKVGLAVGGGLGGGTELMEDSSVGKRLGSAAIGAVVAPAVGKVIEEAIPAAQNVVGAISQAPKKLLQKITGIDPKAVKTFQDLGIDPTLADVSKSAGLQNFIKDMPIAGKPITEALQKQVNDISGQIQNVVKSQAGTYEQAGAIIKKGAENYINRTENAIEGLYGELGRKIGDRASTPLNSTLKYINEDVGLLDTMSIKKGGTLQNTVDTIKNLTQDEIPNYERIRKLRSKIRREKATMIGDERREMETLYDNMTKDMKESIRLNGGENALKLFEAANKVYATQKTFINDTLQPLIDAKLPEQVYSLATRGSKAGGTRILEIMKSLKEPQKDFLRATFVKDLGLAQKGAQGAEADLFSPQKFMAEYSVLKKNGAEKAIFAPKQVTAFNRLNKAVELTKNTEQAGKSNQMLQMIGLSSVGFSTKGVGLIPAIGGGRITANLMTNPKFINWLAVASQATPKELPKQLNRLSAITAANPEIREDVLDFVANFGASDANAKEPQMSEEQIRRQLIQQRQQYPMLFNGQPIDPQEINAETQQIKQRYLK